MTAELEAVNLGKRYSRGWALRDCAFPLPEGRIAALVGFTVAEMLRAGASRRRPCSRSRAWPSARTRSWPSRWVSQPDCCCATHWRPWC
ncbi:hypothetical protein ALI144C_23215 [Actinosynnema sp. ALI-1.44]|nr:hypothetical protein ALI144C_23215 [Actinosynnema sp. ALI-1.44]